MSFLRKMTSWVLERTLSAVLILMIISVVSALYLLPVEMKPVIVTISMFFLVLGLLLITLLALIHRLEFRMGFRNLIRHKSDTAIAILGFMIGTSIICSSMAIGDTLGNMIEGLVYDGFDLTDEYMTFVGGDGELYSVNGTFANEVSDVIEGYDDETDLIDGISWEYERDGSVIDLDTILMEPRMNLRSFHPDTTSSFGELYVDGEKVQMDLEYNEVYITSKAADLIEARAGHTLQIFSGLGMGNFTVRAVLDQVGRANSFSEESIFMSREAIWDLFNETYTEGPWGEGGNWSGGVYNILKVSNTGGRVEGGEHCDRVIKDLEERLNDELVNPLGAGREFEFTGNKADSVDQAKESMDTFTKLFLAFGAFTIIVGITLIINIFVMLSEERKEEMGITRAIGMKRKELRLVYLFEGTFYSFLSSFVGVLLGLASGYGIIVGMQSIFNNLGFADWNIQGYYTITPLSIMLAFVSGFAITIVTTLFITARVARLNIVSAIRSTPVPKKRPRVAAFVQKACGVYDIGSCSADDSLLARTISFVFDRMTVLGILTLTAGFLSLLLGIYLKQYSFTFLGLSFILIGMAMIARYFLNQRATYTLAGALVLLLWTVDLPFFDGYSGDIEMFVLSGVFMVTSGVLLLVWNTDIILWIVEKIVMVLGASPASIKMAVSYPLKKRFRTGVTIFMFALIIFTITGMSMITNIMNLNIDSFERTLGGGYDLIGVSQTGIPDLREAVIEGENNPLFDIDVVDRINWEDTVSMSMGLVSINISMAFYGQEFEQEFPYQCAGVSDHFIEKNTYGFSKVDWDLVYPGGKGPEENSDVWNSIRENDTLVILDGAMIGEGGFGPPTSGLIDVGDVIELVSFNGTHINRTVIAFTEQQGINAVFMYNTTAERDFGVSEEKVHLFRVKDGEDIEKVSDDLRRALLFYGFYTIIVRDLIETILETQNSFFDLLNAFLSLGLVIGVIGLGIVTLRSVYERRHEIGMMRAIGFKKRTVIFTFLGESSFIAGAGLLIGSVLGMILGWNLWRDDLRESMPEFGIPWLKIAIIVGIAFLFAVLSSIAPSAKASRVVPAEALRYE